MADSFSVLRQKIIDHPFFQKTKDIIENTPCHDNELVYDHLLATAKRAEKAEKGEFITNEDAKKAFEQWMNGEIHGMAYRQVAIITALLHDIGKILVYKKNGEQFPIVAKQKNGSTLALGHEYWGSTLVPIILNDVGVSKEIAEYISCIVRLHSTFLYSDIDKTKTCDEYISEVKSLGQGFEKEILFNTQADVATCRVFKEWLQIVGQMFNTEQFYKKREYSVM